MSTNIAPVEFVFIEGCVQLRKRNDGEMYVFADVGDDVDWLPLAGLTPAEFAIVEDNILANPDIIPANVLGEFEEARRKINRFNRFFAN